MICLKTYLGTTTTYLGSELCSFVLLDTKIAQGKQKDRTRARRQAKNTARLAKTRVQNLPATSLINVKIFEKLFLKLKSTLCHNYEQLSVTSIDQKQKFQFIYLKLKKEFRKRFNLIHILQEMMQYI